MKKSSARTIIILTTVILIIGVMFISAYGDEITIKAGTPLPIRLEDTVSSQEATTGQIVRFTVTRDVKVDGVTVIRAGAEVIGEVTHAEKAGSLGREGRVSIVARHTIAIDGTRVPLRATLADTGKDKVAVSIVICPFIKGGKSLLSSGTETKAFVDYDTKINI